MYVGTIASSIAIFDAIKFANSQVPIFKSRYPKSSNPKSKSSRAAAHYDKQIKQWNEDSIRQRYNARQPKGRGGRVNRVNVI